MRHRRFFFYENSSARRTTTSNKLNRCKTLVFVACDRKILNFRKIWFIQAVLVDFAHLKESIENAFLVISFTRKRRHFQPSVKYRRIIKRMASKQQFLPEKLSKFNSTLHSDSLIECQIKYIVRKIMRAVFTLSPQPNGALQNYSILRPDYRSVRFLDTCIKKLVNTEFYASRKRTIIAKTVE